MENVPTRLADVCYTNPLFAVTVELKWKNKRGVYLWKGDHSQGVFVRVEVKQSKTCPSLWHVSGWTGCPGDSCYGREFHELVKSDLVAYTAEGFVMRYISEAFEEDTRPVQITTKITN